MSKDLYFNDDAFTAEDAGNAFYGEFKKYKKHKKAKKKNKKRRKKLEKSTIKNIMRSTKNLSMVYQS